MLSRADDPKVEMSDMKVQESRVRQPTPKRLSWDYYIVVASLHSSFYQRTLKMRFSDPFSRPKQKRATTYE